MEKLLELERLLKEYKTPKLSFCFIPGTCAGSNLRSLLSREDWNKLRREEYRRTKHECEICSNKRQLPLHCHEEWSFDVENFVQELDRLIVLCEYCHAAKHLDGTARNKPIEYFNKIVKHIREINDWTKETVMTYANLCQRINRERSEFNWTMHVSYIYNRNVVIHWTREPFHRHPKGRKLRVTLRRSN